jgi:hypothetical protein
VQRQVIALFVLNTLLFSPQKINVVVRERLILAHDQQIFYLRLRDHHTVEWVAVMERKLCVSLEVLHL